jgi:cysteine desulfurase
MQVNNETGMVQPIPGIAAALNGHAAFLHVDAAQGFGKAPLEPLRHPRIDLDSVSGHKLHAPQGIGALVARRRGGARPPLAPLMFGGGQERTLRPGTHPVHLIAGLGMAASLALDEHEGRAHQCQAFRQRLLAGLAALEPVINGDARHAVPHIVSLAFPGLDAEQVIAAWRDLVAISQGAACTSQSYTCSHVLSAMRLPAWQQDGAVRLSWYHATPVPDVSAMVRALERVRQSVEGER